MDNNSTYSDEQKIKQAYSGPLEHMDDLMERQSLLVRRMIIRFRTNLNRGKANAFPGFAAISDEEVDAIFQQHSTLWFTEDATQEENLITERIARLDEHISERVALSIKAGVSLPFLALQKILIFRLSKLKPY